MVNLHQRLKKLQAKRPNISYPPFEYLYKTKAETVAWFVANNADTKELREVIAGIKDFSDWYE